MGRSRLDRLFAAFQRSADAAALAKVFDSTAPELLRVARYLSRDEHGAEDLVQGTFLKAIERRDRYDVRLPVMPWLLGILANAARHERRQRSRTAPPPGVPSTPGPAEVASQVELQERLHRALQSLPEPYRDVLVQRLEQGHDTAAIADATGRKPSTVRTQVARGMELLRRALPAGIGTAVAAVATPGRGLAAVRAEILGAPGVGGGAVAGAHAAGVITMKTTTKILLLAAAAALLACPLLLIGGGTGVAVPASGAAVAGGTDVPPIGSAAPRPADREQVRELLPVAPTAGLQVIVRRSEGSAAAGIGLYLFGEGLDPLGRTAVTDADGRAAFADLPAGRLSIKPDRAPPQDATLLPGANTVELVLPQGIEVNGLVVDPAGTAVGGARVFAQSIEHHDHAQLLATADESGRFRLRDVAPGTVVVARAPSRQPSDGERSVVVASSDYRQDLVLRLGAAGFALRGRVTDATGQPVPRALVAVGVDKEYRKLVDGVRGLRDRRSGDEREVLLLRADEAGWFQSDEVPEGTALLVACDLPPGAQVGMELVEVRAGSQNECSVIVRQGAMVHGVVRDEEGQPFAALPLLAQWRGAAPYGKFAGSLGHLLSSVAAATARDGSYRLSGLLAGEHVIGVGDWLGSDFRPQDRRLHDENVVLAAGEVRRLDITVVRRADLRIRLLGPDGEPLAGWGVWVDPRDDYEGFEVVQRQRTDRGGRVTVHALPRGKPLAVAVNAPCDPGPGGAAVDGFAARWWHDVFATEEELVLRLQSEDLPSASLHGRLVDSRGAPVSSRRVELLHVHQWADGRRLALGADGSFMCLRLPAGEYRLRPRTAGDPWLGPFTLAAGQNLDLGDVRVPDPGTLRVSVTCTDGGAITGATAKLFAIDWNDAATLEMRGGLFRSTPRAPGRYRLYGWGTDLAPGRMEVEILAGREQTVELRCDRGFRQQFVVVLPRGASPPSPLPSGIVEYAVRDASEMLQRGFSPTLDFALQLGAGQWELRIDVPGFQRFYQLVRLPPGGTSEPVMLEVR